MLPVILKHCVWRSIFQVVGTELSIWKHSEWVSRMRQSFGFVGHAIYNQRLYYEGLKTWKSL